MHNSLEFMTQQKILRGLGLTLDQGLSSCMKRSNESTAVNGSNINIEVMFKTKNIPNSTQSLKKISLQKHVMRHSEPCSHCGLTIKRYNITIKKRNKCVDMGEKTVKVF